MSRYDHLKKTDQNGALYWMCGHCSKSYAAERLRGDDRQEIDPPATCARCSAPMDSVQALLKFSEAKAAGEHDVSLAALGKRIRGAGEPAEPVAV